MRWNFGCSYCHIVDYYHLSLLKNDLASGHHDDTTALSGFATSIITDARLCTQNLSTALPTQTSTLENQIKAPASNNNLHMVILPGTEKTSKTKLYTVEKNQPVPVYQHFLHHHLSHLIPWSCQQTNFVNTRKVKN